MSVLRLDIAYNGASFYGSAPQPNLPTVHDALAFALAKLGIVKSKKSRLLGENKTQNQDIKLIFSGRTDRYVHASFQVVSLEYTSPINIQDLPALLARHLPSDIDILNASLEAKNFHARFSATSRTYCYYFVINKSLITPFNASLISYLPLRPLDLSSFHTALKAFVGRHDFYLFSKSGSNPQSSVREVFSIELFELKSRSSKYKDFKSEIHSKSYKNLESEIHSKSCTPPPHLENIPHFCVKIEGNSFLRRQICLMVSGALMHARGEISLEEIGQMLKKPKLKRRVFMPSPPFGLYLHKVCY